MPIRRRFLLPLFAIGAFLAAGSGAAHAQGKSNHQGHLPPGQAKKHAVTVDSAVVVTRAVLAKHGYEVVRVEEANGVRVVYYRRGNRGRGKGKGPLEKMIIRPSPERIVIDKAPPTVLVDINVRLGF